MSNDPEREDSGHPTEPSTRPKDYVAKLDLPDGLQEDIHAVYEAVTNGEGEGGSYENVRLAFRVPPKYEAQGSWNKRCGWLVWMCEVTGGKFAVPKGAPVPVIAMDKPKSSGDGAWLHYMVIHPDLVYDRPQLLEELARDSDHELYDLFYDVCGKINLLEALSEMDELPDMDADPYPSRGGDRAGYEIVGEYRPACAD